VHQTIEPTAPRADAGRIPQEGFEDPSTMPFAARRRVDAGQV